MDKDNDFYYLDGVQYPRVTRILAVLNRPMLNDWRAKAGYDAAEDWTNQTRDIGTEVHEYIAKIIGGYSVPKAEWDGLSIEIKNGLTAWEQSRQTLNFKPIEFERLLVSHKYGYAGTTDCIAKVGKELEILDWKVSSALWPETLFQLAAYYMAYTENGKKLSRCRAIRLDRDRGYWTQKDQLILEAEAVPDTFKAFLGLFEVYRFLNKLSPNGETRGKK